MIRDDGVGRGATCRSRSSSATLYAALPPYSGAIYNRFAHGYPLDTMHPQETP